MLFWKQMCEKEDRFLASAPMRRTEDGLAVVGSVNVNQKRRLTSFQLPKITGINEVSHPDKPKHDYLRSGLGTHNFRGAFARVPLSPRKRATRATDGSASGTAFAQSQQASGQYTSTVSRNTYQMDGASSMRASTAPLQSSSSHSLTYAQTVARAPVFQSSSSMESSRTVQMQRGAVVHEQF